MSSASLAPDLVTHGVFLLVQGALIRFGDVTMVELRHIAFLLANCAVLLVKLSGLRLGKIAFADFALDTPILISEPRVHFLSARMLFLPSGFGVRADACCAEKGCHRDHQRGF